MDDSHRFLLVDTDPVVAEMLARAWTGLAAASTAATDAQGEHGGREQQ